MDIIRPRGTLSFGFLNVYDIPIIVGESFEIKDHILTITGIDDVGQFVYYDATTKRSIEELKCGAESEYKLAIFAYKLLHGLDIDGHWIKIDKLNDQQSKDDTAKYEVDYCIRDDGVIIGYLDTEEKQSWEHDVWPYPKTNIPRYPMTHWQNGHFNGNHTKKLQRFSEKPDMSFWIAARKDWGALWAVKFSDIVEHGLETEQKTRYSMTPLPIIEIENCWCTLIENADDFTRYITDHYKGDEW